MSLPTDCFDTFLDRDCVARASFGGERLRVAWQSFGRRETSRLFTSLPAVLTPFFGRGLRRLASFLGRGTFRLLARVLPSVLTLLPEFLDGQIGVPSWGELLWVFSRVSGLF